METRDVFQEFKYDLIHSTILDKEVLDNLISKCVLTLDDREEIDSFPDQSSRNQKLLEILIHRPYNTFSILVDAMKDTGHDEFVKIMKAKMSDKDLDKSIQKLPYKVEILGVKKKTVKLIKWYKILVHNMDIVKTGILDKLFAKEVICHEDNEKIKSENLTSQEKNRILLGKIVRKNISAAYFIFLDVLKEDVFYKEYAAKIEDTEVLQVDLELLCSGIRIRERKRNGMSDLMIDKIEKCEKDDSLYIVTRATSQVLVCIQKYSSVSVTGPSGCGKTALVSHVALQMERKGYTILTVTDAKEIKENFKPDRKTLYIVDDMCGNFTANQSRIEEWKKYLKDIQNILENSRCKLILTCRLQVFQDKGFESLELFKACECNLQSKSLSLTSDEKKTITKQFFKEHALEVLEHLGEYEFLPLLCKVYHVEKNNHKFTFETFLKDPFSFYGNDLTHMYKDCKQGKYKYCALLLLVIFNNKLEGTTLTGKDIKLNEIIEEIKDVCDIDENITGRKLKIQLETLIGTFVICNEGRYETIHDKLFDFLASYFGTQKQIIDILITHAKGRFVRERFVTDENKSIQHSILIPDDKLQMYMKRVLDDIVISHDVEFNIWENKNLKNVKFRSLLRDFMRHLSQHEITTFMEKANTSFLNTMFVASKKDIRDNAESIFQDYSCFGIVLPYDMFQQYIEKWFFTLMKTYSTEEFMNCNRLLSCVTFRNVLSCHMRQLSPAKIVLILQNGSSSFINTMFVRSEHDIKDNAKKLYERFGVVIPDGLLQEYIERWFDVLKDTIRVKNFLNNGRLVTNFTLRTALRSYMRLLTTERIASLIQTAESDFINRMFVMTKDDIEDHAKNQFECFGIVIPVDLVHPYIQRWIDELTKTELLEKFIDDCRPLKNETFRTALRKYMRQLSIEKISSLIQNGNVDFINTMFVKKEDDIKDNAKNRYECFGIVIPDDILQQYIEKFFNNLTNEYDEMLNMNKNRALRNAECCTALRKYIKQLTKEKIVSLIQNADDTFINEMFVITEDEIKHNAKNLYTCFGVVIPQTMLQQYIERWFHELTETDDVIKFFDKNRCVMNFTMRTALHCYMKQLNTDKIASLIQIADSDFIKMMFVMRADDIKNNADNRFECFGIVIPNTLLQQYIERLFDDLTKSSSVEHDIDTNRLLMDATFCRAFRTYISQLTSEKIASNIQTAEDDFFDKMFVIREEDIKENADNQYECFGIVIPDELLQLYFERLLDNCSTTRLVAVKIYENRPLVNVTFRIAFCAYMRQLEIEKIGSLIQTAKYDFINTLFVMTDDNIKDYVENRNDCFGIVIPDDLLHRYIERLFEDFTITSLFSVDMNVNRPLVNVSFRVSFRTYIRQLSTDKIASLIQTAGDDFINVMFVMTEDNIKDNAENRYECFGIVVPFDLLQQYIERWFDCLTATSELETFLQRNRTVKNYIFRTALFDYIRQLNAEKMASVIWNAEDNFFNTMFYMTEEDTQHTVYNQFEYNGILIPNDLLQEYFKRLIYTLTEISAMEKFTERNRPLKNVSFYTSLRSFLRQINRDKISVFIWNASNDFVNTMFVMEEADIKNNTLNQTECLGIVLADDLIQQYIQRWIDDLTQTCNLETFIIRNRPLRNVKFCTALRQYIRELNAVKITSIIWNAEDDFVNEIFVMTQEDIKDNTENRYECFGIVIPDDQLQQYIERWFECLTKTSKLEKFMDKNKSLQSVIFRTALCKYMKRLDPEIIASQIRNANIDFLNMFFVMAEEDINENIDNRHEWYGIIIPIDLVPLYTEKWFNYLTKTRCVQKFMDDCRPLRNVLFWTALHTYMKQLNQEKIGSLIQTSTFDFTNRIFVMTEQDIKANAENRYERFGIVIPDHLLQQYIERWFPRLSKKHKTYFVMSENRLLANNTFRLSLGTYIKQLNTENIASLIRNSSKDFLNTMYVMTEDDIIDKGENRYECFDIVIPDDLIVLQQYIEKWFDCVTHAFSVKECMNVNRPLMNDTFRFALSTFMILLDTDAIRTLIQTGSSDFINTMFVSAGNEKMIDNADNKLECFGIVIPGELSQEYTRRWIDCMTKADSVIEFISINRSSMSVILQSEIEAYMDTFEILNEHGLLH